MEEGVGARSARLRLRLGFGLGGETARNAVAVAMGLGGIGLLFAVDPAGSYGKATHFMATRLGVLEGNLVFICGIAMAIAVEAAVLGWGESSLRRLLHPSRSTAIDAFCFVMQQVGIYGALTWMFSLGLASVLPKLLTDAVPPGALAAPHPVLQFLWLLVATDFVRYWMHVCQHRLSVWWEAHKFHHCATELNVITTGRAHPVDHAFQLLFLAVPTALLGGSVISFLLLSLVLAMHAGFTHSMLNWNFGWIGRWVLVSPIAHRIHHSDLPEHRDRNLGSLFIVWDRMFCTWYGGRVVNRSVGVDDNYFHQRGLAGDFLACFWRVCAAARAALPRRS